MALINPAVSRLVESAKSDPEQFWAQAADQLPWFRKWDRVFEWDFPSFRWFLGAQTNLAYNCLDHHVANGRGDSTALIYINERGERRLFTYSQLTNEVERIAAALRGMGIQERRPTYHLYANQPRGDHGDAGDRPGWRHPLGGLRRVRRWGPGRAHPGQRLAARLHHRRHLPQGWGGPAQRDRGLGPGNGGRRG